MQWNSSYQENLLSFANNINTHEGGTHLSGFRSALTRTINAYAREKGVLKEKDPNLQGEDIREGLTAIISVKIARPAVRGPDEDQARQPAGRGLRPGGRQQGPRRVPRGEPAGGQARHHEGRRGLPGTRGRPQGPRPDAPQVGARELDAPGQAGRLLGPRPARSPSCSSSRATPPAARPSRAATATPRRSCRCAARSSTSRRTASTRCSSNTEIQALITAIGTGIRDEFDIEKAPLPQGHRHDDDADVDGAHIRTLVLTFLFREMPELIEQGTSTSPSRRSTSSSTASRSSTSRRSPSSRRSCCATSSRRWRSADAAGPSST